MIIILSPSKTLDFETTPQTKKHTKPEFIEKTKELVEEMKKLSTKEIMNMMSVSEKIAELNYDRYQNFQFPFTTKNAKQAILAFKGDVYRDIEIDNYTEEDFEFAQEHVRTLSGLYGLLKPLDLIQPYRLEMKYKTDFWKDKITPVLNKHLKKEGSGILLNLASNEYSKPIQKKELEAKIITPHFKEKRGDKYKTIAIYSKLARGTMTNWIVKNRIENPEEIKNFKVDKYKFMTSLSKENDWVFAR